MAQQPRPEVDLQKLHPWWRQATAHGTATKGWFAMARGSAEHKAWEQYFGKLGWMPNFFRDSLTREDAKEITMPCQWPEWLVTDRPAKRPRLLFDGVTRETSEAAE